MNKPTRRRRRGMRAAARALAVGAAVAALVAILGAGQAPGREPRPTSGSWSARAGSTPAAATRPTSRARRRSPPRTRGHELPRRFFKPEPPVDPGPRLDADQQIAPAPPPPAPASDPAWPGHRPAVAALLLVAAPPPTWRIYHRRPRPEPTT